MELPINLDLLVGNQKFGLDMCIKSNDEYAKRLVASLRGTVVKMIDPAELPVAVISDRRYAQHLQVSSHDDQMKLFKVLPLMLKDAVLHKIPIVSLEQFAAEVQKRLHSGTPRGSSRKRPLEEPIPNPYHTDNEPPSTLVRIEDHHVLIRDSDPQYATILKAIDPSEIVFHLGTDFGSSLFDKATPEVKLKRTDELVADESHDIEYVDPTFKEHGKPEMVRAMVGYCDYCKLSYADIFMHCKTAEHQAKVDEPDGKFDALDEILYKYNDFLSDPVPKDLTNNNATPAKDVKDEHTKDATEKPRAGDLPRSKTRDSVLLQTSEMSEPGIRTANEKVVSDGCLMRQNEGLKEQN